MWYLSESVSSVLHSSLYFFCLESNGIQTDSEAAETLETRKEKSEIKIRAPNLKNHLYFCQKQKIKTKCKKKLRETAQLTTRDTKFFFANSEKTTLKVA